MLDDSATYEVADPRPGPGSVAELAELAEQVKGCVAGLSTRDATAIVMVTQLGFTPEQVAGALGLTPGAAKVLLHRPAGACATPLSSRSWCASPTWPVPN